MTSKKLISSLEILIDNANYNVGGNDHINTCGSTVGIKLTLLSNLEDLPTLASCLVPKPKYSARTMRFWSRGPSVVRGLRTSRLSWLLPAVNSSQLRQRKALKKFRVKVTYLSPSSVMYFCLITHTFFAFEFVVKAKTI